MSASFRTKGWICARRATDRDLDSVIVRRKENAWMCAQSTTDCDLQSFNVNAWIFAQSTIDRDLERVSTW